MNIGQVMTPNPIMLGDDASIVEAAQAMRDNDIGDVLVSRNGELCGIVTDRDIVVKAIAGRSEPATTRLGDICTSDVATIDSDTTVEEAADLMREKALRRIPVVDDGSVVGIVSLGDLAVEGDSGAILSGISAAPPNN